MISTLYILILMEDMTNKEERKNENRNNPKKLKAYIS